MRKDIASYEDDIAKQEKTPARRESWVTQHEVQQIYDKLRHDAEALFKKPNKTNADLQAIQNYVIMTLYSQLPVRRSLDYCMFRIKGDFDKKVFNHIEKGKLQFVTYQGSEKKGKQTQDKTMQEMGSSSRQAETYVKLD